MFSILQSLLRKRKVVGNRSHDGDCIDQRIVEYVIGIHSDSHRGVALTNSVQRFRIKVTNGHYCSIGGVVKVSNDIGTPISVTNHTDINRLTFAIIRIQGSPSMDFEF